MSLTGKRLIYLGYQRQCRLAYLLAVALVLLTCLGCSGNQQPIAPNDSLGTIVSGAKAPDKDWRASPVSSEEFDDLWASWLIDPGEPEVDYDPSQIIVGYKRGAKLSASTLPGQVTTMMSAADMPNSIMRHDHSYEQLTDAIAAFSGLPIKHQVYNDHSLWASFKLKDTANHRQIADAIATQFASVVEYATFAGYGNPAWTPNDPDYLLNESRWDLIPGRPEKQWGQRLCNFEEAWEETRGSTDVWIGHIDDAFLLAHEELEITYFDPEVAFPDLELDVANDDNDVTQTGLDLPHGTWVGGILAAEGNNRTIIGAAPSCRVVPFRIAQSSTGKQSNADFAAAINLAIDMGVKVINASWGSLAEFEPQRAACTRAYDNGVLVVASAMNDGNDTLYYPASYEYVLGVGGTGDWSGLPQVEANWRPDKRTFFSCYGPQVDIAAPGVHLKTTRYDHNNRNATNLYTEFWAGTSASCPLVAGTAALMWSARPSLSVDDVVEALMSTGQPTTDFPGAGGVPRLDAGAAMASVLSDPTVAGSVVDHLGNPLVGVSFELSSFGNASSGAGGNFAFELVPPGSYTLTPSLADYIFSPPTLQIELGETDLIGLEFTGTLDYLPLAASLSIADGAIRGNVVGDNGEIAIFVNWEANPGNAVRVVYNIDFEPLGEVDLYDLEIEVTDPTGGFIYTLDTSAMFNQQIGLVATPYAAGDLQGAGISLSFWLFNQLGDTDGSGVVDEIDLDNYNATIGLKAGDPGYSVFLDSDLDGVITEADAAAVGYFMTPNP